MKTLPELPYQEFSSTAHLLHMGSQAIGKLKLLTPFEPQWANVPLLLTSRGLTTGPIPYKDGTFSIDLDLISHEIICTTSWGKVKGVALSHMSVAQLVTNFFDTLRSIDIDVSVNPKPQEIPNPILFNEDTTVRAYDPTLANRWWQILLFTYKVMSRFHARFLGKTQPIGFMWGTFDIRDVRYNCHPVEPTGLFSGYLRRNAMDEELIEVGWWHGNDMYQKPAFYSFTYPQPSSIEQAIVQPKSAHWDKTLGEFILDYDELRKSQTPDEDLLAFFESTYMAGAKANGWDSKLIGTGKPS